MFNSLRFLFVAIVLVGGAKLIEVGFYDVLKTPSKKDKQYHGEVDEKVEKESETKEPPNLFEEEAITADTMNVESADSEVVEEENPDEGPDSPVVDQQEESLNDPEASDSSSQQATASNADYFQELKNTYLSPILANLPEGRSREDIVIRYYRHDADGNKVNILRSLGYYLHEREAEDNRGLASNSLYYGSDVDIRDIQVVAFALLEAGMPLREIKESQYDWKYNSLEIGADSLAENSALLSRSDIVALSN